ncbi:MAG: threonine synthase [Myxococcales bacterium]|nr:threonine synthase [Polyangiaceae bacterium]MDW8250033.1 threonine synthase [Myxococcales bacterium]
MRYLSTRGQAPPISFLESVLGGLAPDGGLYVPETWPHLFPNETERHNAILGHYAYTAARVLLAFSGGDLEGLEQVDDADALCLQAYLNGAWPESVAPLRQIGVSDWLLELFRGPSLSFKDVAMQLLGPLYDLVLRQQKERLSILCATSGDTGGAAVEAFKNRETIDLFVLTPRGRVSSAQRRFMTTSGASNIHVLEVNGDFDICQALVKQLFSDTTFATRARLSGVNSINWGRIAAQSVYFARVAHTLGHLGPVHFVVPTGNFGDAYSGWVARQLGAPVGRILLATNANDVLVRALETGEYRRGPSRATLSPAMDIQLASNFERILFEALDRNADQLCNLQRDLSRDGACLLPSDALARLRTWFSATSVSDEETLLQLRIQAQEGNLVCPHTAVGLQARTRLKEPGFVVTLATAHPAKFPETVKQATGEHPPLPPRSRDLFERPERFEQVPAKAETIRAIVRERSRAWR